MKMSDAGRAALIKREGMRTKAYKDSVGVLTIGVGHTSAAGRPHVFAGMVISRAEADAILARDLEMFERAVNEAVHVSLTQGQFDALVSLAFNIGAGGFRKSTVVRRLNAGDYHGAADAFLMWNKPKEIMGRRRGERAQFLAATGGARAAAPVRLFGADELHPDEAVTADYLRASGSKTIAGSDFVKKAAAAVLGADTVDTLIQAKSAVDQLRDAFAGWENGAGLLELAKSYWPLAVGLAVSLILAWLAWRALHAAKTIEAARVERAILPA